MTGEGTGEVAAGGDGGGGIPSSASAGNLLAPLQGALIRPCVCRQTARFQPTPPTEL